MKDALLDDDARRAAVVATLVSGLLIAQQTAGRATRDALFLSIVPVSLLPIAMIASSVASLAAVAGLSWLLARRSPFRVLPVVAGVSATLLLLEWALSLTAPTIAAIAVYLHLALFGGTLVSAFWSLVNERFDPHAAKRVVGRIGFGASVGGVAGGLVAWGASRVIPVPAMLLVMALLMVATMAGLAVLGPPHGRGTTTPPPGGTSPAPSPFHTLRRVPYLGDLAFVVALGAVTDGLLDYVLKSQAAATLDRGPQLMAFFAALNAGFGLMSLVVQAGLSRTSLRALGLAGTVALRPATVLATAILGLLDPRMWVAVLARAGHDVNTSSLFRSGYELLFTPLPEAEKRPTKAVIDVGFDKLGSLVGGAVVLLAVSLVPSQVTRILFALAAALCLVTLAFTGRLHRGYVRTLEESLRAGLVRLEISDVPDEASRLTLTQTSFALDRNALLREIEALRGAHLAPEPGSMASASEDSLVQTVIDLRSGKPERVRHALRQTPEPPPMLVPHLIPLLARDELFLEVLRTLRRVSARVTGQLVDALLDPGEDPAVRLRLPRVLKACPTRRAVEGLFAGLNDGRLDVRVQCALSLANIIGRHPELSLPKEQVFEAVRRELGSAGGVPDLDHVFTLLSLALDREPLHMALQALRGTDRALRGTAIEYLENVLPEGLRGALWPHLGESLRTPLPTRPARELAQELLRSPSAAPQSRAALRARLPHPRWRPGKV